MTPKPDKADNATMVAAATELVKQVSGNRQESDAWGEVLLRMKWENGILVEFRLNEENIARAPLGSRKKTTRGT